MHKKMIIVRGVGVYTKTDITSSEMAMVDCICDVLALVPETVRLKFLTDIEVTDLLNWGAEKNGNLQTGEMIYAAFIPMSGKGERFKAAGYRLLNL